MRFCEGRPERATRAVTADERRALAVAARRAARKARFAVAGLALPLVAPPAAALLALALGADPEGAAPAVGVLALFALLGGLPVAVLFARDALRASGALRRDERRGEVVVFGDGAEETVVLAESHHVVGRGGAIVAPIRRGAVGEAAAPPPAPAVYALSAADSPSAGGGAWAKRALSADERAEIERHARRFGRVPPFLVVASLALGAATAAGGLAGDAGPGPGIVPGVALGVVLALHWGRVVRDVGAAARLRADAVEGWAYRGTGRAGAHEVLPASGAAWTLAGVPAEWRLHHGP